MKKYFILTALTASLISPMVNAHGLDRKGPTAVIEVHKEGLNIPHSQWVDTVQSCSKVITENGGSVVSSKLSRSHDKASIDFIDANDKAVKVCTEMMQKNIDESAHSHMI